MTQQTDEKNARVGEERGEGERDGESSVEKTGHADGAHESACDEPANIV